MRRWLGRIVARLAPMAKDERFLFSSMVATTAKIAILTSYYGEKSLRAVVKGGQG